MLCSLAFADHASRAPAAVATLDLQTRLLDNGLTVASVRMPAFRTLAMAVFVRAGGRDEPARLAGLSHVLEHMAFKGTATRDAASLSMAIERAGASMNAYTTKDHTVFHVEALAEAEAVAITALADVVLRPSFPADELARERQVILQEIDEAADDSESLAQDAFDAVAWPKQALGRPILGAPRQVRTIRREDLITYHARHYCGENLIVVGAGQLDHDRFADGIERHFGGLARGARIPREPARYVGGSRHVDQDFDQTAVIAGWPTPPRSDPAFPVCELLAELLGGGASSPLFQQIRERHGLAYRVDAWLDSHDEGGTLQIAAGVSSRNLNAFFDRIGEVLQAVAYRIDPDDLERTHNQRAMLLAQRQERPLDLAEAVALDLMTEGRVRPPEARLAAEREIGAERLSATMRALIASPPSLALVGRAGRGDLLARLRSRLDARAERDGHAECNGGDGGDGGDGRDGRLKPDRPGAA